MRRVMLAIALAVAFGASGRAEQVVVDEERVVPENQLAQNVEVRDVRVQDGVVMGTVVNRSGKPLRDVRLVIRRAWLWNNEFRPGTDDPSRAEFYTLPGDIPPGARVDFTHRPEEPLPQRSDGHFETQVRVASVVQVSPGSAAAMRPASPTAGVGEQLPPGEN